ncbi:Laccase-4 [Leucoagaricus sp. SymC.cos]|nr:Laccase-4 [Leucoagaricus sp. SymC.cos]
MRSFLQFTTFVSLSVAYALGATISGKAGTLTLSNQRISPDGFTRSASVINGIHPGPVITLNKGESASLNVVNQLTDEAMIVGATIHWHGMFQRKTNFMDGTEGVTQCPIAPGKSFKYSFNTDEVGTYWYHSHFGEQYCDGIRGAFIIYDPNDPLRSYYDVDDESTIISLSEWYHTPTASLPPGPKGADSTLINGKGRYPTGDKVDLAIINVTQGKRYRLRIISMSCDPFYTFSIDGHDLTVIEVEGTATKPYTINTIPVYAVYAGQRYSVVLNANQRPGNYWIRALPNSGNRGLNSTFDGGVNSAILRYAGALVQEPKTTIQTDKKILDETQLHPSTSLPPPGKATPDGADVDFKFTFGFDQEANLFTVNGTSYKSPSVPVLLQMLSDTQRAQDLMPKGSVFEVPRNKTVQLDFPAFSVGGPHPFHLHGHSFWVVKSADQKYNFVDPIIRDTVNGGNTNGDIVSIRFTTDNPGPWIFHCHIDFHLKEGLAVVFAEAPGDTKSFQQTPPDTWKQLCVDWNKQPDDVKHAGGN